MKLGQIFLMNLENNFFEATVIAIHTTKTLENERIQYEVNLNDLFLKEQSIKIVRRYTIEEIYELRERAKLLINKLNYIYQRSNIEN